jgi:glucokinase
MPGETILVGDVGGTNVRFAIARNDGDGVRLGEVWKKPGDAFPTFDAALAAFVRGHDGPIDGAALGAAGAVSAGRVDLLNRSWSIDAAVVGRGLGVGAESVVLVNDFMAMARSVPALGPDATMPIAPGAADPEGSIAVGGPGTGFGVGVLRRLLGATGYVVVGGEGGHQLFTPQCDLEWRMTENLREAAGYVSNELVAAGVGFELTLKALARAMDRDLPALPADEGAQQAEVLQLALAGDPLALEFCRLRARTVMAALGDAALSANTTGGVFIAGGVAARLEPWLREPAALSRFHARGPRTQLLQDVPIRLITGQTAPLLGGALLWLDRHSRGWI